MVDAKRFRPKRRKPEGAFWDQEEAVFIGVRERIASTDMKTAVIKKRAAWIYSKLLCSSLQVY
jgi:hypothetical protein